MSELFKNKYRIDSARLKSWDYGSNGVYFITICTQEMICYFGDVIDKKMILSEAGKIANAFFQEIPDNFPFIELDEYVVMPNHVHGILIIHKLENKTQTKTSNHSIETPVETRFIASPLETKLSGGITGNHNPMLHENVSKAIRWYKARCTFEIRKTGIMDFTWQTRFHDHIIRNQIENQRIAKYICDNPMNWENDRFYKA